MTRLDAIGVIQVGVKKGVVFFHVVHPSGVNGEKENRKGPLPDLSALLQSPDDGTFLCPMKSGGKDGPTFREDLHGLGPPLDRFRWDPQFVVWSYYRAGTNCDPQDY